MPLTTTVRLPTEKKQAVDNIYRHTLLIGGEKKTGKTSFCSQWDGHFILECEPGNASHLSANYEDIFEFDQAVAYLEAIEKNPTYCKVLIIDELKALYDYCYTKVRIMQKMDLDEKFGFKEWGITKNYFRDFILRLQKLQAEKNIGLVFTCHTELHEIELTSGRTLTRMEPRLSKQANELIENFVKFYGVILFNPDSSRCMQIEGNDYVLAYNGFPDHFRVPNSATKLTKIEMGVSPVVAFTNFNAAYNNTYVPQIAQPQVKVNLPVSTPVQQNTATRYNFKKGV